MVWRETESYKCLFLGYEDGAQHNPLHEAVHGENLDFGIGESLRLETVCGHISRSIQKQTEHIGLEELQDILSARKYFRSFIHSSIVPRLQ